MNAMGEDRDGFLERAQEISDHIKHHLQAGSYFFVISHNDADGLSSASIIATALTRAKARFTLRIVEELREEVLAELSKARPDITVFADIGSGYLDLLRANLNVETSVVLDHHPPNANVPQGVMQLNPHDFGIDGARMVSAAGVCYFVSRFLSENNKDLSTLGIVGALGDMQDRNEKKALVGMNELVVSEAVSSGNVLTDSDLIVYGRETRPIHRALAYTTAPYLPNLSGREDNCLTLLSNNGIKVKEGDRFRTPADLSQAEKQQLLNAIIAYLTSIGFQSSVVLEMVGTVYSLTKEAPGSPTRDGREFSALLNACGRTDNSSVGIGVGMGDRKAALEEANEVISTYRKTLADYMEWLTKSPEAVQKLGVVCVVRGEDHIQESMTGAFSSILSSAGGFSEDNAVVVLTRSREGGFKLSARAPQKLLDMGINLGSALNSIAKKYSGFGGGHNVAAGAYVKVENPDQFLHELDSVLLAQRKNHGS